MLYFETVKMNTNCLEAAAEEAIKIGKEFSSDDAFMADLQEVWPNSRECAARTIVFRVLSSTERKALLAACGSEQKAYRYVAECVDDGLPGSFERAVRLAIIGVKGFVLSRNG